MKSLRDFLSFKSINGCGEEINNIDVPIKYDDESCVVFILRHLCNYVYEYKHDIILLTIFLNDSFENIYKIRFV